MPLRGCFRLPITLSLFLRILAFDEQDQLSDGCHRSLNFLTYEDGISDLLTEDTNDSSVTNNKLGLDIFRPPMPLIYKFFFSNSLDPLPNSGGISNHAQDLGGGDDFAPLFGMSIPPRLPF